MRKNFRTFFVVTAVLIISFVACFFIKVDKSQEITIKANFFNVLRELNSPDNWKNWQTSLKKEYAKNPARYVIQKDSASHAFSIKTPNHSFTIEKPDPVTFEVKEISNKVISNYNIHILSTLYPHDTHVVTTTRVSLWDILLHNKNMAFATTSDLKSFVQNPIAYYGYNLVTKKTVDTIVVVKKAIVLKKDWNQSLSNMYNSLDSFIKANNLTVMQPKIVSFSPILKDSVEIRAGIPVDKAVPDKGDIRCLKMPKGFILVGQYKGPYNQRTSLSEALKKYIQDHSLEVIAVPYEKYLNNRIPESDSSIVTIQMCYPIL